MLSTPYPQPAKNTIHIEFFLSVNQEVEISLYNILGQRIISHKQNVTLGTYATTLNLNQLAAGMYIVTFRAGDLFAAEKIMKVSSVANSFGGIKVHLSPIAKSIKLNKTSKQMNFHSVETATFELTLQKQDYVTYSDTIAVQNDTTITATLQKEENMLVLAISGRVFTADGDPIEGLRFFAQFDSVANPIDSTDVATSGEFTLVLPDSLSGKAINLYIDSADRNNRIYRPSMKRNVLVTFGYEIRAVLLPRDWVIQKGVFADKVIPVSMETAFAIPNITDKGRFYGNFYRNYITYRQGLQDIIQSVAWPDFAFPIPVFFIHEGESGYSGNPPRERITSADSLSFWNLMEDLENRFGMDLFRPTSLQDVQAETLRTRFSNEQIIWPFTINVSKIPDLVARGLGGVQSTCGFGGEVCERYDAGQIIYGVADYRDSENFGNWVTQHEMIHALGLGHACFPSLMRSCFGGYEFQDLPTEVPNNCPPPPGVQGCSATEYDVAYFQLYQAVHHLVIEHDANFGIVEALEGERVFELDVGPLPECFFTGKVCTEDSTTNANSVIISDMDFIQNWPLDE